jgi:GTP-binding protein LepA
MTDLSSIRNFSIIAHIDHGKSTLADRLIQRTGGLTEREMSSQVLDNMDIEQERGITIKAQTVRLDYKANDGKAYVLNLMDTPGHVDFAYEVSRSSPPAKGASSSSTPPRASRRRHWPTSTSRSSTTTRSSRHQQGRPPRRRPDKVRKEIEDIVGLPADDAVLTSAKTGIGIDEVLEAIVTRIPPPTGDRDAPLKAMLVDSWYDPYLGVVILIRVVDGAIRKGQMVKFMIGGTQHLVDRVGAFRPKIEQLPELGPGEIGFITAQIKDISETRVGDTITDVRRPALEACPASRKSSRWCSAACSRSTPPISRSCANRSPSSGSTTPASRSRWRRPPRLASASAAASSGLLHLEIIQERLTREYDLDLITTAPSVVYKIHLTKAAGEAAARTIELHNPADMPDPNRIASIEEPWIEATIYVPDDYLGPILKLCQDRRGIQKNLTYVAGRAQLTYELPLNEVVFDFYDRLKSISRGYASFDYHQIGHREGDLVKMSILVNNEPVDALSMIVHRGTAEARGRGMCERLKDLIPRHLFKIPIQAAIGGKVIARETIAALRKDVTAKCYGGDASRKKKLLEKQKEGKKRMREYGSVSIPQEAFIAALRMGEE